MYYNLDWEISIGGQQLAMLDAAEITRSVDTLADACTITLPGTVYNKAYEVEEKIKRGMPVLVRLGYNDELQEEFKGYVLRVGTDDGSVTIDCEDAFFLLRKPVKNKEFKNAGIAAIAQYVIDQTGAPLTLDSTLGITYDKFVIHLADGYDVLKKLKEETNASIYIKDGKLNIHPPYIEKGGDVAYSFQQNIESGALKYVRQEDKKIQVVVTSTGPDGKKREVRYGTTGGEEVKLSGAGMSESGMDALAKERFRVLMTDGYDGSITGWLIPYVEPTWTAQISDADYPYKDGRYYVKGVTTTFSSSGGVRQVELGIKVGGANV